MHMQGISRLLAMVGTGTIRVGYFLSAYVYLTLMVFLMALDPVMRYLVGSPFYWSNEVTTYLMVLMVFNGFGIALIKDKHIRVTLIFDRLPLKVQNIMWVIISVIGLLYVTLLGYTLLRLTISSIEYRVRSATAEMLVYPWQIMAMVGMCIFLVAMIMFLKHKIAVATGRGQVELHIE
jgi:TRAP-type C4-dicarboxylate transport system permease small subunit